MMGGGFEQMNGSSGSQEYLRQEHEENTFDDAAFDYAFEKASADVHMQISQSVEKVEGREGDEMQNLFREGGCITSLFVIGPGRLIVPSHGHTVPLGEGIAELSNLFTRAA